MKIKIEEYIVPDSDAEIYRWYGYSATCPRDVNNAIRQAGGERLEVVINSGGGDIFAGSEIYTALRAYGNVLIQIVGLAASAASIIAMAGESEISPTGMVMAHNVSSYAEGDYHAMDRSSDVLQRANQALAQAYMAKTGMSEQDVLAMMDRETWLTARQAVDTKLVNRVMFETPQFAAAGLPMLPRTAIEKIRNILHAAPQNAEAAAKLKLLQMGGIRE